MLRKKKVMTCTGESDSSQGDTGNQRSSKTGGQSDTDSDHGDFHCALLLLLFGRHRQ